MPDTQIKRAALNAGTSLLDGSELVSLPDNGVSPLSAVLDNSDGSRRWGWVEVILASLTPTVGACVTIYVVTSLDGTNYDDGVSSTNPASHEQAITLSVKTGSGAKRITSSFPFDFPPAKCKFALKNNCNVALASSGNSIKVYYSNEVLRQG